MVYIRYLALLCLTAAIVGAMFITANYVVDPYRIFSEKRVKGFNDQTPALSARRLFQPLIVASQPADVIVLGSSRGSGILHAAKEFWPEKRIVNANISALRAHEAAEFLSFYARRSDVEHIIFQPDFFAFNAKIPYEQNFVPNIVSRGWLWRLKAMALFSVSAMHASIRTVLESRTQQAAVVVAPSTKTAPKKQRSLRDKFAEQLSAYQTNDRFYLGYVLDEDVFDRLAEALETVKASGKTITLLLGPSHALQWEAVVRSGNDRAFAEWKRAMARLGAATNLDIWDFADYSPISTLPIEKAGTYFTDSSHYTKATGIIVLQCINRRLDCKQVGGRTLTSGNIDTVLQQAMRNRQRWINESEASSDWQTLAH